MLKKSFAVALSLFVSCWLVNVAVLEVADASSGLAMFFCLLLLVVALFLSIVSALVIARRNPL